MNYDFTDLNTEEKDRLLEKIIKENFQNTERKILYLTNLNFEGFTVKLSKLKAKEIYNIDQSADKIYNHHQNADEIWNSEQKANIGIYNSFQKASKISNTFQLADSITNSAQASTGYIKNNNQNANYIDNTEQDCKKKST